MADGKVQVGSGGVGFCGLLAILFIGLKLGGVIEWGWLWVLAPIWIPFAAVVAIIVIVLLVIVIVAVIGAILTK